MRSTPKDRSGYITFSAAVVDAASGSGLAQPGNIPFTFTRNAAGTYTYSIDPRIRILGGDASHQSGGVSNAAAVDSFGAGVFRILTGTSAGTLISFPHSWTVTARDSR